MTTADVAVIGAGASGLAAAYVPLRVATGAIGRTAALHDRE